MRKTGNNIFLKEYNRRMLLGLVRQHTSITYVELTKLSGLAPKSVYEICDGLIKEEYCYESAIGESGGGRKPKKLSLKPNSYYSIGVDVDLDGFRLILMDITGTVCDEYKHDLNTTVYYDSVNFLINRVKDLINRHNIAPERLLGIGLSVPGLINAKTKHIVMAPNLGWENRDILSDIKQQLPYPLYLENESLCSAICEKWVGECKSDENFICINIKSGIGAGIFTSDKPYRGIGGSAGEIGHIPLDKDGPLCGCKNRGCLEAFASSNAILHKAKELIGADITLDRLTALADKGDQRAVKIFNNAAEYLGIAITFLVNTFNPSKIILGKDFVYFAPYELDILSRRVASFALKYNAKDVQIKVSGFGERSSCLGAAILPQQSIF